MTLSTWWLFVGMTFVVSATPGPNMLYVMRTSARHGLRTAVMAMLGCMAALLLMMSLSAAGLGAVLQRLPAVFDTLRLLGAAYLAYLGVKCWRAPVTDPVREVLIDPASIAPAVTAQAGAIYRQGFLVAASNPKAILFAVAFLPQFIDAKAAQFPQFAILLATFSVIEVSWYMVYAASGQRLSRYLRQVTVMKMFNRLTGGAFIGFAMLMARSRG